MEGNEPKEVFSVSPIQLSHMEGLTSCSHQSCDSTGNRSQSDGNHQASKLLL